MDAFDSDVLIYAARADHDAGRRVRALFRVADHSHGTDRIVGTGAMLLLPETLIHPMRHGNGDEVSVLDVLLSRLDLRALDEATGALAVQLGAEYGLKAADATHLATAVNAGADRFITSNRRDFPQSITEVDVTYPDDLPEPS